MDASSALKILVHGNQLKRTARTGWAKRGIPDAEDVAAHSYGVAFAALVLTNIVDHSLDLERVLSMAVIHDLPEGLTGDIPTPSWRYMPDGIKNMVEESAMKEILEGVSFANKLMALWYEFDEGQTLESRLVQDADKIDLYLQALIYEEQTSNRHIQEFWSHSPQFHFPQSQAIYEEILNRRPK